MQVKGKGTMKKEGGEGKRGGLHQKGEIPPCGAGRRHKVGDHQETRWRSCQATT